MSEWDKASFIGKVIFVCQALYPIIKDLFFIVCFVIIMSKLEEIENKLNNKKK